MNVLIIGGSSDIGISLAKKLRDNKHQVLITYNSHNIELDGIEVTKCDVKYEEDIERVIKQAIDLFGQDFILMNLASISMDNSFLNKTKNEFMSVLEVNLVGMFLCNQIYARYNSNGLIVNMSSTDGIDTYSEYSLDYSVSKTGIITMSKIISECNSNKVICLCPNWIDSLSTREMNQEYLTSELKRIGQTRLIKMNELIDGIYEILVRSSCSEIGNDDETVNNGNIINNDEIINSGDIIRIDIKDDKLWIEKM